MHYIKIWCSWKARYNLRLNCETSNNFQEFNPIFVSKHGYNSVNKSWLYYELHFPFSLFISIFSPTPFVFICSFFLLSISHHCTISSMWQTYRLNWKILSFPPRFSHSQSSYLFYTNARANPVEFSSSMFSHLCR